MPLLSCHTATPAVKWDDGTSPFPCGWVDKPLGGLKQPTDCPIPSTYYICVTGELFGSEFMALWDVCCFRQCCALCLLHACSSDPCLLCPGFYRHHPSSSASPVHGRQ